MNTDEEKHPHTREWLLQVSAGCGPVEVRRFVALLAEHLAGRCRDAGVRVRSVTPRGDARAPSSVVLRLDAMTQAIGSLAGTHALVARGDERGRHARKRWYAGVTVHEAHAPTRRVALNVRDVEVTATRAGGPGGQHVNKTSSAVRAVHAPSGVAVRVTDERSRRENTRIAMERIAAALTARASEGARAAIAAQRLAHHRLVRATPTRTYEMNRSGGIHAI